MSGRMTHRTWLLAGLLCLSLPAAATADCTLAAVAVLPLRVEQNHFVFTADINGKPANLVLDTGFFATTLNRPSAGRFDVRFNQLDAETYGIGGTRHQYRAVVRRLRIGQLNADGMVVGGNDIWKPDDAPGWDGVFGMNMMAAYDIDLDIVGQHAILFEADGDCHKPTVALAPNLYKVRLEPIQNNREADISVTIEGHRFKALLDTGASQSSMYRGAASRLGLDLSGLDAPNHGTAAGVGPFRVNTMIHVFRTVQIGDLQIHNMPIDILSQKNNGINRVHVGSLLADADRPDEPGGEDMLLGADFFQRFHVWISHSSHTVILQYPPVPSVLPH